MQNQISIGSCNRELPQPPRFTIYALLSMGNFRGTVTLDLGKLSDSPLLRAGDWIEGVCSNILGDVFEKLTVPLKHVGCLFDVDTMAVCLA